MTDTVRLNTPSKSVVKLGGFSVVEQCEHDCDSMFFDREAAHDFARGINSNWANMRRSLAALTEEECHNMDDNIMAWIGKWWEEHKQPRREARSGRLQITLKTNTEWRGWMSDDQLEGRMIPPGTWTQLAQVSDDPSERNTVWMTDTPVEVADQMEFWDVAHGRVLVNGLGLGMMQEWILKEKPCVEHMDIVEINQDIINLISPYLEPYGLEVVESPDASSHVPTTRVTIYHADAYEIRWPKTMENGEPPSWDVVFHDIWPSISDENLEGMKKLRRKYSGRAKWQGCWAQRECEQFVENIKRRYGQS